MLFIYTPSGDSSDIFHAVLFKTFAGSADKTLKFWDLETFELIGSSGPEVPFLYIMTQKVIFFMSQIQAILCSKCESAWLLNPRLCSHPEKLSA